MDVRDGGIQHTTVVQAKDWSTAADQGELLKFRAVLDDLPGQLRGIVVTRTGYQRGAAGYARANGILLWELTAIPDPPAPPPLVVTELSYVMLRILGVAEQYRLVLEVETFIPEFTTTCFHSDTTWFDDIEAHFGFEVAE